MAICGSVWCVDSSGSRRRSAAVSADAPGGLDLRSPPSWALSAWASPTRVPRPGWRHHRHNRTGPLPGQPFDQGRAADSPGPDQRTAQLQGDEVEHRPARVL
jgi:hypothetical protein